MWDFFNLTMLVAAAIGALAFGVLAAYAVLRAGFTLMGRQRRTVAVKPQPRPVIAG
jgi:hypothetical protein